MFRDDNDQFLKSFEVDDSLELEAPIINIYEPQTTINYQQQVKIGYNNILNEHKRQGDRSNDQSLDNEQLSDDKKQPKKTKRLSIISSCFSKTRKLSGDNLGIWSDNKQQITREQGHRSQASYENSQYQQKEVAGDEFDKKSKGYAFNLQESEGAFWKKLRNLQTRLKNLNLNNNTLVIKTKQQNTKLLKQNGYYRQFFTLKYPNLLTEINTYIAKRNQQEQDEFLDSSSESSKAQKNDEWMPILSKLQQIKIDVTKVFQVIKQCQQKIGKMQRENTILNNNNQSIFRKQGDVIDTKKKGILRKFSIPAKLGDSFNNYLFHSAKITEQYSTFKIKSNTLCQHCKQPRLQIFQTDQRNEVSDSNQI